MKISDQKIGMIGIISGLVAVFGAGLFQEGAFVLLFAECGISAGPVLSAIAVLCIVIYVGALVGFAWSFFCLIKCREGEWKRRAPFIGILVFLFMLGAYQFSKSFIETRNFDFVFEGDVEGYQKISGEFSREKLNDDLWLSARWGRIEMTKYLVSRGADPNARLGGKGGTVLEAARENLGKRANSNQEVVDSLVSAGAQ